MKHIESILPEQVADELTRFLLDDATISSALKDLLHRNTGCVIPSLDNVPTSDIEEIIPLCLSILRRFWNTPLTALGDGTDKKSIADTFKRLINNSVKGNEALGISPANENIAAAISALTKRHIDDGLTLTLPAADTAGTSSALPDGISLAQLLCGSDVVDKAAELIDNNRGWVMTNAKLNTYYSNILQEFLPNLSKLVLGCRVLYCSYLYTKETLEDISLPDLELISLDKVGATTSGYHLISNAKVKQLSFPKLISFRGTHGFAWSFFQKLPLCRAVYFPELSIIDYDGNLPGYAIHYFGDCPLLEEVRFPKLTQRLQSANMNTDNMASGCPNLVLFEIGDGYVQNLYLAGWSPTTALAERLDEFLYNFQHYIANRVADRKGKETLTLTLSSAVYEALEAQEGQTILATLANKNWNVAQA